MGGRRRCVVFVAAGVAAVAWLAASLFSCLPPPDDAAPAATTAADAVGLGLVLLSSETYDDLPKAQPPEGVDIPPRMDLRRFLPVPGDQGESQSCVAWALSYMLTCQFAQAGDWDPSRDDQRLSPAFLFAQMAQGNCSKSSDASVGLNLAQEKGCCTWASMPYDDGQCAVQPSDEAFDEAQKYRPANWTTILVINTAHVRAFVASGSPVLIGIRVYQGFRDLQGRDATYVTRQGEPLGDHAIAVVGYDDDRRAFLVINSWGTAWGDGGYAWIAYDVWSSIVREGYVIRIPDPESPTATPTDTPTTTATNAPTPSNTPTPLSTLTIDLGGGVMMDLVHLPAGSFVMGSPETDPDHYDGEQPQRTVHISAFAIGRTEVTQAQWRAVMGSDPSYFTGDNLPVEQVSWNACQLLFCAALSQLSGLTIRLPTEAEWEYACRAGSTTRYSFGDDSAGLGGYAWYVSNSSSQTHDVAGKLPNGWGLYDMHGNVLEWCNDWYGETYYGERPDPDADPPGPASGDDRIVRGGAWNYVPRACRSALRYGDSSGYRGRDLGFRVAAGNL